MSKDITRRLQAWYKQNARRLPWRGDADPYTIWVSEIMLQQTRVETVIPYFRRWMERFPDLETLAKASEQEVLLAWEGLGYYSRARNLHHSARLVIAKHAGKIPRDQKGLQALPGIGRYTAGAISSIAFGMDEPVLDGNVRRVLARIFNVSVPARSPEGERQLWALARDILPPGEAGDHNQALMDLGALVCIPRNPACAHCPLAEICQTNALGLQDERPVMGQRPDIPHHIVTAAVIRRAGKFLITRRPSNGLLGGMWEFPGGKVEQGETLPAGLKREIMEELGVQIEVGEPFGSYRHAYTHFRVTLHAFLCRILDGEPQTIEVSDLCWAVPPALQDFPMGKIDRQIARRIQLEL
jgi:A/G-specific adenine glycosylase